MDADGRGFLAYTTSAEGVGWGVVPDTVGEDYSGIVDVRGGIDGDLNGTQGSGLPA